MKIGNTKKGYGDTERAHAENLTIPQTTANRSFTQKFKAKIQSTNVSVESEVSIL